MMTTLSLVRVQRVIETHGLRCYYCDYPLFFPRLGIPLDRLSRGGTNDLANLVPACRSCNSRKQTKTESEFDNARERWQCLSS